MLKPNTTPTEAREGTGSRMDLIRDAQALHRALPVMNALADALARKVNPLRNDQEAHDRSLAALDAYRALD